MRVLYVPVKRFVVLQLLPLAEAVWPYQEYECVGLAISWTSADAQKPPRTGEEKICARGSSLETPVRRASAEALSLELNDRNIRTPPPN